jgi:hypothetical protein
MIELTTKIILHFAGLCSWFILLLLLMQVVVCKDARALDIHKFLSVSRKRRFKIFKRNLTNTFYLASFILFLISACTCLKLIFEFYRNDALSKHFFWLIFHPIVSFGIYKLYSAVGYRIEYLSRFREFWKGEHE